jgi:hypothetical protein
MIDSGWNGNYFKVMVRYLLYDIREILLYSWVAP